MLIFDTPPSRDCVEEHHRGTAKGPLTASRRRHHLLIFTFLAILYHTLTTTSIAPEPEMNDTHCYATFLRNDQDVTVRPLR
jgi:hypothetical protein